MTIPLFRNVQSLLSSEDCDAFDDDGGDFGINGENYDADSEGEDYEDLEDMSPAALAKYLKRAKRDVSKPNDIEQSGGDIKKRSYSTNLKRQREHWKEFVTCVTGESAWHAIKDWGNKDPTTRSKSGPLCDCREIILLPIIFWTGMLLLFDWNDADFMTGWRMEEFIICEIDCPYKNGMLGFLSKQCYPSSPKKPHFAFSTDFPEFFHHLYMGGSSSKQGFCTAVQHFLKYKLTSHPEIEYEVHIYFV